MYSELEMFIGSMSDFENAIDYSFKNKQNLLLALTHSSYANENKSKKLNSNERLEFLGDAVLNIIISEYIYTKYSNLSEGEMTKARANIVCESSLFKCANSIVLGKHLILGKGEELSGGRTRTSILSDAFEALIGSIYIDGGIKKVRKFLLDTMSQLISDSINGVILMDYKTQLQEIVQKSNDQKVIYEILEEKGPDHNKIFISQVSVSNKILGIGEGRSKKEAEQNAARAALEKGI